MIYIFYEFESKISHPILENAELKRVIVLIWQNKNWFTSLLNSASIQYRYSIAFVMNIAYSYASVSLYFVRNGYIIAGKLDWIENIKYIFEIRDPKSV